MSTVESTGLFGLFGGPAWVFCLGLTPKARPTLGKALPLYLLVLVERVQVLQGGPDELQGWVTIDEGQVLAGFQVTAGLDLLFLGHLHLLPLYPERLGLGHALLDGGQRGRGEGAQVFGARDVRQAGHPLILLLGQPRPACGDKGLKYQLGTSWGHLVAFGDRISVGF